MPASTEILRLTLRSLANDANLSGLPLRETLEAAAFGTVSRLLTGKVLIEAQSSGVVTRYQLPQGVAALQPQEISAMLSRLLDLMDACEAALTPQTADSVKLAWLLSQLTIVRSFRPDFSNPLIRQ